MLSSDKNVAAIGQLVETARHYVGLQKDYLKLDVVDKFVRLLAAFVLLTLFLIIIAAIIIFYSFALAFWLSSHIGHVAAFSLVGGFHILVIVLLIVFRKPLIERPLVSFLANQTLEANREQREQLATDIQKDNEQINTLWNQLTTPQPHNTKGEWVVGLINNSVTAIDAFLLVRKLMKTYGSLFGRKKKH